jgi:AraC family transcriptional activator of tynA and feaB
MEYLFTTDRVPEAARALHWRDEFLRVFDSEARLEHDPARPFRGEVATRDLGTATLVSVRLEHDEAQPHVIRHDPGPDSRDGRSSVYLLLKLAGTSRYHYEGGSQLARPGDVVLFDGEQSWASESPRGRHQTLVLRMAREPLLARLEWVSMPAVLALRSEQKLGGLIENFLRSLARLDARAARPLGKGLVEQLQNLLVQSLNLALPSRAHSRSRARRVQLDNIREYLHQHLGDPDLGPGAVAARFGISTRYLHRLHAEQGQSLSAWVMQQRLERCRRDLDDPSSAERSVTDIAMAWGFNDLSHFGRCFRAAYGLTPSEWRKFRPHWTNVDGCDGDARIGGGTPAQPLPGWLDPRQATMVREQLGQVLEHGEDFAPEFYRRLFELAPDARALFQVDMAEMGAKLLRHLAVLVAEARSPEKLAEPLARLGLRHADYGVRPEHYALMSQALMATLSAFLGSDFNSEAHSAWLTLHSRASEVMIGATTEAAA